MSEEITKRALLLYQKGVDSLLRLRPRETVTYLNEAIKIKDFPDAYYVRGLANAQLGNHDKAIIDYDRAIKLNPLDTHAFYNRGKSYRNLGKQKEAIRDFRKAVNLEYRIDLEDKK